MKQQSNRFQQQWRQSSSSFSLDSLLLPSSLSSSSKRIGWFGWFLLLLQLLLTISTTTTEALNVLVVGGTGRVGGSTVRWLQTFSSRQQQQQQQQQQNQPNADTTTNPSPIMTITVACRNRSSFEKALRMGVLPKNDNNNNKNNNNIQFLPLDLDAPQEEIQSKLQMGLNDNNNNHFQQKFDLVIHTAGPFQGRTEPVLLESCMKLQIPYLDVCDEYELAKTSKERYHEMAQKLDGGSTTNTAIISAGIWPGVSALLASKAKQVLEEQIQKEQEQTNDNNNNNTNNGCDTLDLSFFTAGTGNAGPTILSATFLLLATPVLTFVQGQTKQQEPWTDPRTVDFGPFVGKKPIWLLDNPDVPTTALSLKVPNVSSRFGTDPLPWNYLFYLIKLIPKSLLQNRQAMQQFALFSEPIVRIVDRLVGSTNAMRVDAISKCQTYKVTATLVHPDLESCVGLATAAFAMELLKGRKRKRKNDNDDATNDATDATNDVATIPPGVWYPAELPSIARDNIIQASLEDAVTFEIQ